MSYPPRSMGGATRASRTRVSRSRASKSRASKTRVSKAGVFKGWMLIPASVAAALLIALMDGESGIGTWLRMRAELGEVRARIDRVEGDIDGLQAEVAALRAGGFAVERAIREQLGYARADETVVLLPREDPARPAFLAGERAPDEADAR